MIGFIACCLCLSTHAYGANSYDDKSERCKKILNELKVAKGLLPDGYPNLSLVPVLPDRRFLIAMINNKEETIFIQEKTYDLCIELMEADSLNGLAFILAHELAHYLKKHNVRQQFISNFQGDVTASDSFRATALEIQPSMESEAVDIINDKYSEIVQAFNIRKNEAEADLEAGFLCYRAGYPALEAGPKFLDLAYQVFDISDNSGGKYATLEERKTIVKQTGLKLDSLIQIFEVANYLTAAGEYFYAAKSYEHIARLFESKEILNNIALLNILDVSLDIFVEDLPYALPLTLETSLFETSKPLSDPPNNESGEHPANFAISNIEDVSKNHRLNTAIRYLDRALSIDQSYSKAYLNKSICYFLKYIVGKHSDFGVPHYKNNLSYAQSELLKGFELVDYENVDMDELLSDLWCQSAILNHAKGDTTLAELNISKALEFNPYNAFSKTNLRYFNGIENAHQITLGSSMNNQSACLNEEKIFENKNIEQIIESNNSQWSTIYDISLDYEDKMSRLQMQFNEITNESTNDHITLCAVSFSQYGNEKESVYFVLPKAKPSTKSACGIKLKDAYDSVISSYGKSNRTLNKDKGRYETYVHMDSERERSYYIDSGIIFDLDSEDRVSNWIVFLKQKLAFFDPQFDDN